MLNRDGKDFITIRNASARFGRGPKETDDRDTCHTPAIGYVSQTHGDKHAIIRRVPQYREANPNRYFIGYTEELVFTGSEAEVEKRLQRLLEELWEKKRQDGIDKRAKKRARRGA